MSILPIYLDNNATTPRDKRVLDLYLSIEKNYFGNASSNHIRGWEAEEIISIAKEKIAVALDADPSLIIFTSGASESNNLAIRGFLGSLRSKAQILTSQIDHSSIFETVLCFKEEHYIQYGTTNDTGVITFDNHESSLPTLLISHHANNEIGTIQNLSSFPKGKHMYTHIDCAQSFGKIPLSIKKIHADSISISAHKIYGPVGIGALIGSSHSAISRLQPQITGGNQQSIRAGTLPVALIAAFGEAASIVHSELEKNTLHIQKMTETLVHTLFSKNPGIRLIGEQSLHKRLPGNLSLYIPNISADKLIQKLSTKVCISKGAACISNSEQSSRVLKSLHIPDAVIQNTIRIGVGAHNTEEEILLAAKIISDTINVSS